MIYDILKINEKYEVVFGGRISIYNTDKKSSLSSSIKNTKEKEFLKMSFDSNNVYNSKQGVYLFNTINTNNKRKVKVGRDNFLDCVSAFSCRKIIKYSWINEYSEFLVPDKEKIQYMIFSFDSIVYSLFNSQNLIIPKNEFFWMSKEEMLELANNNNYTELYNDARTDTERYVYKLLFGEQNIYNQLSEDAKLVLDKATDLVRMSFNIRQHFADETNHLNSWDAGYAQLKLVWKEYFPEEFKEFRQLYKNLEDRMRPLVYELGFLIK